MATSKIKKVRVPKNDLPPAGPNNSYLIRYRVVSEDRNRSSHWSQLYNLSASAPTNVSGSLSLLNDSAVVVTWDDNRSGYDLFVKVDNGPWRLQESPKTHGAIFLKPQINTEISVAVQIESYLKVYDESLVIYEETLVV